MSVPLGVSVSINPSIITNNRNPRKLLALPSRPSHELLTSVSFLTRPVARLLYLEVPVRVYSLWEVQDYAKPVKWRNYSDGPPPEIVVWEARLEDCWVVAETHCSSYLPGYSFPLGFLLRVNRLVGMFSGFSVPKGRHRVCFVAVASCSASEVSLFGNEDFRIGGLDGRFSLNKGNVALDTLADFLPWKGPLRQRRFGIAYISNVAVREVFRRKSMAKGLVSKAETQARRRGCQAVGLHCDTNNLGATKLYKGQGFKCVKFPEGASWPQPQNFPGHQI